MNHAVTAAPVSAGGGALRQALWIGGTEAAVTALSAEAAKAADRQGQQATVVCPAVRALLAAAVSAGEDQEAAVVPAAAHQEAAVAVAADADSP